MTQEEAELIAYQWKYKDEYSFYDIAADREDLQEFLERNIEEGDIYITVFTQRSLWPLVAKNETTQVYYNFLYPKYGIYCRIIVDFNKP